MLLEKNGRVFIGKIRNNINIIYFFMLDGVQSGEVNNNYYPADSIIGGCLYNPLQG